MQTAKLSQWQQTVSHQFENRYEWFNQSKEEIVYLSHERKGFIDQGIEVTN